MLRQAPDLRGHGQAPKYGSVRNVPGQRTKGRPRMNFFRTMLLLSVLTALFMAIGFAIGGGPGMTVAFLIAAGMNLFAYWNSDRMVLAQQDAQEVDEAHAPELYGIVRKLAQNRACPCRASTSSIPISRMPSPRAATRKTPPLPPPPDSLHHEQR